MPDRQHVARAGPVPMYIGMQIEFADGERAVCPIRCIRKATR